MFNIYQNSWGCRGMFFSLYCMMYLFSLVVHQVQIIIEKGEQNLGPLDLMDDMSLGWYIFFAVKLTHILASVFKRDYWLRVLADGIWMIYWVIVLEVAAPALAMEYPQITLITALMISMSSGLAVMFAKTKKVRQPAGRILIVSAAVYAATIIYARHSGVADLQITAQWSIIGFMFAWMLLVLLNLIFENETSHTF